MKTFTFASALMILLHFCSAYAGDRDQALLSELSEEETQGYNMWLENNRLNPHLRIALDNYLSPNFASGMKPALMTAIKGMLSKIYSQDRDPLTYLLQDPNAAMLISSLRSTPSVVANLRITSNDLKCWAQDGRLMMQTKKLLVSFRNQDGQIIAEADGISYRVDSEGGDKTFSLKKLD